MKKCLVLVLFAAVAVCFVLSQNCSTLIRKKEFLLQENFNLTKYSGIWYEVRRNKTSAIKHSDCNRANYTIISGIKDRVKGTILEAWHHQHIKTEQNGFLNITTAGDTKGNLTFANVLTKNTSIHWVMKTNYNYSLVYSCSDITNVKGEEHIYIFSRNKTIDAWALKEATDELKKYENTEPELIITNQTHRCDKLMGGGVLANNPSVILVFVHVIALSVIAKLL